MMRYQATSMIITLLIMRMMVAEGQRLVRSPLVNAADLDKSCRTELGSNYQQYEPSTNHDVQVLIDELSREGITRDVWIKSTYDSTAVSLVKAFSWKTELVGLSLWFRSANIRREPDENIEECTILRRKYSSKLSDTNKHMVGNKFCDGWSKAMFYCIESPSTTIGASTVSSPETTTSISTTTAISTTTPEVPPTVTATPSGSTDQESTTSTSEPDICYKRSFKSITQPSSYTETEVIQVDVCPCPCPRDAIQRHFNISREELEDVTNQIRLNLTLNPRTLSTSTRRKSSAVDDRTSSRGFGIAAIGFLFFAYGGLVLMDMNHVRWLYKRPKSRGARVPQKSRK